MLELRNVAISIAIEMSGFALLVPIFGSKLYIVLFRPKKNTTEGSHYDVHTTTDIKSVPGTVITIDGDGAASEPGI